MKTLIALLALAFSGMGQQQPAASPLGFELLQSLHYVVLDWDAPTVEPTGITFKNFRVYRSENNKPFVNYSGAVTLSTYTDQYVSPNGTYVYYVTTVGNYSQVVNGKTTVTQVESVPSNSVTVVIPSS